MRGGATSVNDFTLTSPDEAIFLLLGVLPGVQVLDAAPDLPKPQCPTFNANNFPNPTVITNPYSPWVPGSKTVYAGFKQKHSMLDVPYVTHDTKQILGLTTVVVSDTVKVGGKLEELALDYFAQDKDGNVWYFGEYTTDYKNGVPISHEGSWEAGVNGAQPGIFIQATPHPRDAYCQEVSPGVAEDKAQVVAVGESLCVPYECYVNVLETREWTPLTPGEVEHKFYAPGVGLIKIVATKGPPEQTSLVDIETGQ